MPAEYEKKDAVCLGWFDYPRYQKSQLRVVADNHVSLNKLKDTLASLNLSIDNLQHTQ